MASLNIRNLPDDTHQALRIQAAHHGRSMEAEVRAILHDALNPRKTPGLGTLLTAIGRDFDGVELNVTRDQTPAEPAIFE